MSLELTHGLGPSGRRCAHELFQEQVGNAPDSIALVFEAEQLTYRELNERANQLAHYLVKLGVGPDVAVGLCLERSLDLIVGLLGILKAGGAYVPLDPGLPQPRRSMILDDAGDFGRGWREGACEQNGAGGRFARATGERGMSGGRRRRNRP